MDAAAIPKFTSEILKVLHDIFVGVTTVRERRGPGNAVVKVARLTFVAGGMRRVLQRIADGQATNADLESLKGQLAGTEPGVSKTIKALDEGFYQLIKLPGGLEIANEIGGLIHTHLGKLGIRERIRVVAAGPADDPGVIAQAKQVCEEIDAFNDRLVALHKRVLKPAAEVFAGRQGS